LTDYGRKTKQQKVIQTSARKDLVKSLMLDSLSSNPVASTHDKTKSLLRALHRVPDFWLAYAPNYHLEEGIITTNFIN